MDAYIFQDENNRHYLCDNFIDEEFGKELAKSKGHTYVCMVDRKAKPLSIDSEYEFKISVQRKINYRKLDCPIFLPLDYVLASGLNRYDFVFYIEVPTKFGKKSVFKCVLKNGVNNKIWKNDSKSKFKIIEFNDSICFEVLDLDGKGTGNLIPLIVL